MEGTVTLFKEQSQYVPDRQMQTVQTLARTNYPTVRFELGTSRKQTFSTACACRNIPANATGNRE
jgi:hypothetical protein